MLIYVFYRDIRNIKKRNEDPNHDENWDIIEAVKEYDKYGHETVSEDNWEKVIFQQVTSLDRDEVDALTHMLPRIDPN